LLERVNRNRGRLLVHLLELLLVVKNGDHVCVVVPVLLRALPIVQVNQHVRQVLVQSVLHIVSVLLSLAPRLLLRVVALCVWRVMLLGWLSVCCRAIGILLLVGVSLGIGASVILRIRVLLVRLVALVRLTLIRALCGATLAVLARVCSLVLRVPLIFIFDLVAEVVFVTFFGTVDSFLLSVLLLTLFFTFLVVSFGAHVLLVLGSSSIVLILLLHLVLLLLRCLLLLLPLSFLLLRRLAFLLVN
jgi:hypothetical protein